MSDKVVQSGGLAADIRSFSIPFDANKYSNAKKRVFFEVMDSWAKNITIFSRRMKKSLMGSTKQNALNSRASPGNY
jgi:hypothetical protein